MIYQNLQAALFTKLDVALSVPVYSMGNVPDTDKSQYCVIGDDTLIDWSTDGETGFEATVTLHSWDLRSSTRGFSGVHVIMQGIYNALNRQTMAVTGATVIGMDEEFAESVIESDGITAHGIQRYRILLRSD
jgi:hypothetical protein